MNQNLKLRILTALIGVPIILSLLLWMGVEGVAIFAIVISTGMLFEFSNMFFKLADAKAKTALLLISNLAVHGLSYWSSVGLPYGFLGLLPTFLFFVCFLFMVPKLLNYGGAAALNTEAGIKTLGQHMNELMAMVFGFVYCGWFSLLMVKIRQSENGKHWLILTLLIVWSSDTFAYFAGKFFGKHLLSQTVSPKKTWEGAIGGTLGAMSVAMIYAHFFITDTGIASIAVIALTVSVAAAIGDLCESMIKRAANVKDSGTILPGHGGFLDRFDGVVFALPVMAAVLWVISVMESSSI
jgi:phosphatidate cytidylyltransferase